MSQTLLFTIITISSIGLVSAVILYIVAQKFQVFEDPRIDLVEEALPSANCGGCGYAGCRAFAESIVTDNSLSGKFCPVGGNDTMTEAARIMELVAEAQAPKVAVLRCNGTCDNRSKTSNYEGAATCAIASIVYRGETECQNGCVGFGDCVKVCNFDAMIMDQTTMLPTIDDDKCTSCGACVEACPKMLIELRKKALKNRKIYVSCRNIEKGAVARKACSVACIACGKCEKECKYDAISIQNNLAYIDSDKCKLCRKCVAVCPTGSIIELNFPARKAETIAELQTNCVTESIINASMN